jgi:DNA primase
VLRLEDSGIRGSVALFGCELSSGQQALLDQAGVMTLIILLNSDEAGILAAEKIKQKYRRFYRMYFPNLLKEGKNDYGDLCGDEITRDVKPIIEGLLK